MSTINRPTAPEASASVLFEGLGEMRARCRGFDWASTPLGPVPGWPQSLRTAVSLVLASGFPSALHAGEDATFVYNDAWAALLDAAHRDALGRASLETFAESRDVFEASLRKARAGETVAPSDASFPITGLAENGGAGGTRWFTFSYAPLRDERGLVSGVVVTAIETTRAREAAIAMHEGATRLRLAVDVAQLGTWEWDLATGMGAIDERGARIVGLAPGPVADVMRAQLQSIHPDDLGPLQARITAALEHGDTFDLEYRVIYPDGTLHHVASQARVVTGDDGRPAKLIGTNRDVTRERVASAERERLLTEAETARAAAEAASRAKSEFLAVMSHELRTPLNAIGGYAELMEMGIRGPVTVQQQEDLGRIQSSQRHLLGLINEVLNYTKLETGMVRYAMSSVVVRDAVREAEGLIVPQVRARGLTLRIVPFESTLLASADPEKLRQVLVNLLSNAVKFTDAGGRIELRCASGDSLVRIHVSDTGIGIPADRCDAIFEPFVQVRSDLTRTAEGTGLGLAISRDLARGMGGELTVESTPGEGSTFTLTLAEGALAA